MVAVNMLDSSIQTLISAVFLQASALLCLEGTVTGGSGVRLTGKGPRAGIMPVAVLLWQLHLI